MEIISTNCGHCVNIFRGQIIGSNDWVGGEISHMNNSIYYVDIDPITNEKIYKELVPESVGQFVNLFDIDKSEAFVGDIATDSNDNIYIIFNCPGGFGICEIKEYLSETTKIYNLPMIYESLSDLQISKWFEQNCKIIGNVINLPESLTNKKGVMYDGS